MQVVAGLYNLLQVGSLQHQVAFFKITVELQSFECEMRYLLTKFTALRYLLMKNRYLL